MTTDRKNKVRLFLAAIRSESGDPFDKIQTTELAVEILGGLLDDVRRIADALEERNHLTASMHRDSLRHGK